MKIICLLQNAWGGRNIPAVFIPNPHNKSAKTMRKMVGHKTVMHFCNTTKGGTLTAAERLPIDPKHCKNLIARINTYDLLIVCGKQAEKAFELYMEKDVVINHVITMHPASRTLSNEICEGVRSLVNPLTIVEKRLADFYFRAQRNPEQFMKPIANHVKKNQLSGTEARTMKNFISKIGKGKLN